MKEPLRKDFTSNTKYRRALEEYEKHLEAAAVPIQGIRPHVYSWIFSATLFTSAALLFMVQPMVGKMLLPLLGGAPSVWTTCMVFFQLSLLGGYLYAHALGTSLSITRQAIVHIALLGVASLMLPIGVTRAAGFVTGHHGIAAVFLLLVVSVGLPFFVLSASAPLLQKWFSLVGHPDSRDPYFLYIASNAGSMLVLLAYPSIFEPVLGLRWQSISWAAGYAVLVALFAACGYLVRRSGATAAAPAAVPEEIAKAQAPTRADRVRWTVYAFVPSSLMLGVTTYFSTDVATVPLFWTLPLAVYLLSYIVAFAAIGDRARRALVKVLPFAIIGLVWLMLSSNVHGVISSLFFHLSAFFLVATVFHGEIARTRPGIEHLTEFYFFLSLGGVLGGMFNGLVAPQVFKTAAEYPIGLSLACILLPTFFLKPSRPKRPRVAIALDLALPAAIAALATWFLTSWPLLYKGLWTISEYIGTTPVKLHTTLNFFLPASLAAILVFSRRPLRFGLAIGAFAMSAMLYGRPGQSIVVQKRSFFGILKVADDYTGRYRTLINGTTLHGKQSLDPLFSREPLTYYHRRGPVGDVFEQFKKRGTSNHYAVIGLGTGTLASYGETGQKVTIYEIDSEVKRIATENFRYLAEAKAEWNVVLGDARLKLMEAPPSAYGLILVDAFSSDAIPVHMLTREAVRLYLSKLAPGGIVAIHTSNRYLSLEPVVANIAAAEGISARLRSDSGDDAVERSASTWIVLARKDDDFGDLTKSDQWMKLGQFMGYPTWTDDYTSILTILR